MIFDSHAHYDDKAFDADRDELLTRLFSENICGILNVGCNLDTSEQSVALSQKYEKIWAAVGVHPHDAAKVSDDYLKKLTTLLNEPKTVAIGEIGLDYHYDFSPRDAQQKVFEEQLKLAKELDIPVIIHNREAHEDTFNLLKKYKPKGVVHCFSGSLEMATEIIKLGMYIGLGGVVTFKNAKNPVLVAKNIPLEKILLETDCPYMAPTPYRGERCDSSMIKLTAEKIASERNISADELIKVAKENTLKLFSKISILHQ